MTLIALTLNQKSKKGGVQTAQPKYNIRRGSQCDFAKIIEVRRVLHQKPLVLGLVSLRVWSIVNHLQAWIRSKDIAKTSQPSASGETSNGAIVCKVCIHWR